MCKWRVFPKPVTYVDKSTSILAVNKMIKNYYFHVNTYQHTDDITDLGVVTNIKYLTSVELNEYGNDSILIPVTGS